MFKVEYRPRNELDPPKLKVKIQSLWTRTTGFKYPSLLRMPLGSKQLDIESEFILKDALDMKIKIE